MKTEQGEEEMITKEQLGNMEVEMNSDQDVQKEQTLGQEPNAQDDDQHSRPPPPPSPAPQLLDDEPSAASSKSDDEEEKGGCLTEEKVGSTPEKSDVPPGHSLEDTEVAAISTERLESKLEKPEALQDQSSREEGEVDVPNSKEEHATLSTPPCSPVALQVVAEEGSPIADDNDNFDVSPQGHSSSPNVQDEGVLQVSSPSGKRRSKGRQWKKNGGKKKLDKDEGELSRPGGGTSQSRDAGTQTDPHELQSNVGQADPSGLQASEDMDNRRAAGESQEEPTLKSSISNEQVHDEDALHESESPSATVGGDVLLEEERQDKVDPSFASLKALRSFGRWADVSEDVESDIRATDTEPDRLASLDKDSDKQGLDLREKPGQGVDEPRSLHITTGASANDPAVNEFRGKRQLAVDVSPRGEVRGSPRSRYTDQELRGKGHQGFESPRSRYDLRADSWSNHKEDLIGKTQQNRDRDSLSQASRETNWRRRPMEPRVRQDTPRSTGKLGLDADNKNDEHQDFRARSQYGAEPQATHKNWIPRRGLHSKGEGEGRAEQSKARGKGKQGREVEPQIQFSKESARQKFEEDLRIKQEELLQRSKQSLKAEFQKAKRIEQARKGGDQLEMELNRNLLYEDGELFYLNI